MYCQCTNWIFIWSGQNHTFLMVRLVESYLVKQLLVRLYLVSKWVQSALSHYWQKLGQSNRSVMTTFSKSFTFAFMGDTGKSKTLMPDLGGKFSRRMTNPPLFWPAHVNSCLLFFRLDICGWAKLVVIGLITFCRRQLSVGHCEK